MVALFNITSGGPQWQPRQRTTPASICLGQTSFITTIDVDGAVVEQQRLRNRPEALRRYFRQRKRVARDEEGRPVVHLTHEVELYDAQGAAKDIRRAHGAYGPQGTEENPLHVRHNLSWSSGPPSDGDDA